ALGLLIAGALAAWVPAHFWQSFFFVKHPLAAEIWGPIIGPVIAIISFVCSVGNVPLAVVLWNGGISFGGVVSFIFADLIVLPVLLIYKKYYGLKMSLFLLVTFYVAMAGAGYVVELLFALIHISPRTHNAAVLAPHISWNYTSILNILFLIIAGGLVYRFLRSGGPKMLKMMSADPASTERSNHS
ncbi:MAG: permease, partial [Candidatus Saccharimonadales bacterium]